MPNLNGKIFILPNSYCSYKAEDPQSIGVRLPLQSVARWSSVGGVVTRQVTHRMMLEIRLTAPSE